MDSGDKATNKAMSAAFKYACMQAFCIPTEGDNDADSKTHEVLPSKQRETPVVGHPSAKLSHSDAHPDLPELIELGKKAFGGNKSHFTAWLDMNFKTQDPMMLKKPQIDKAKGLLLDAIAAKDS